MRGGWLVEREECGEPINGSSRQTYLACVVPTAKIPQATTSAALKLLLRLLTFLNPGLSDLFPGIITPFAAVFVIHASGADAPSIAGALSCVTSLEEWVCWGTRLATSVGSRDGAPVGEAGGRRRRVEDGGGRAGFRPVVLDVPELDVELDVEWDVEFVPGFVAARVGRSLGILLGEAWFFAVAAIEEDEEVFVTPRTTFPVLFVCPATVERVTREGRDSEDGTPFLATREPVDFLVLSTRSSVSLAFFGFDLSRGRAGSTSLLSSAFSSSLSFVAYIPNSSSESAAGLLPFGVFLGCPGGAISLAFACAIAMCRLGVTGGIVLDIPAEPGRGGVVSSAISVSAISSSVSAGGVTGVTTLLLFSVVESSLVSLTIFRRNSSMAPHCSHSCCLTYMYCCWGPTTLPGRTIRMKAMASFAENLYFHMRYAPIRVPVRPSPALH